MIAVLLHAAVLLAAPAESTRDSYIGVPLGTIDALARPVAVAFGRGPDGSDLVWVAELGDASSPAVVRALAGIGPEFKGHSMAKTAAAFGRGRLVEPVAIAIDAAGRVVVVDAGRSEVLRFGPGPDDVETLAGRGTGLGQVLLPRDVAIGPAFGATGGGEAIAVADLRGVQVLDTATGTWRRVEAEGVEQPRALVLVPGTPTRLAVFDAATQSLGLYGADGARLATLAEWGGFPGLVSGVGALAFADGLVFAADTDNHRVQAFDPDAAKPLAYRFGIHAIRPGEGDGALHYPTGLAIRADGALAALAEPLDDRVQIFGRGDGSEPPDDAFRAAAGQPTAHMGPSAAAAGQFLVTMSPESHEIQLNDLRRERPIEIWEFGGFGTRFGAFRTPVGVALTDGGRTLIVVDEGSARLTRARLDVDPNGPLEQQPHVVNWIDGVDLGRLLASDQGAPPILPGAVAVLGNGRIAVVERVNERILVLDDDLGLVASSAPGLGQIAGLAPSGEGLLATVVRGAEGPRVVEFDADARPLRSFGGDVLHGPEGIVRHGTRVFVSDPMRDRIEIFELGAEGVRHVRGFGRRGLGRAEFLEPRGVAVVEGPAGAAPRLVVIDHGNHRGQIFDLDGNFVEGFGGRLYTAPLRAK